MMQRQFFSVHIQALPHNIQVELLEGPVRAGRSFYCNICAASFINLAFLMRILSWYLIMFKRVLFYFQILQSNIGS